MVSAIRAGRAVLCLVTLGVVLAATEPSAAVDLPSLEDRLRYGLKARTASELEFVDRVVDRVDTGVLPRPLVDRVFFWSRRKALSKRIGAKTRRPMVYFQPALTILAARIKVTL